jgi:hypothetical protein
VKRIGRYTLNALTALSLALCVATAGLWARSHWRTDLLTVRWVGEIRDGLHWRVIVIYFASSSGSVRIHVDDDRLYPDRSKWPFWWKEDYQRNFRTCGHRQVVARLYDLSDDEIKRGPPWDRLGIYWCSPAEHIWVHREYYLQRMSSVVVPHALLLAAFALLPGVRYGVRCTTRLRKRRRLKARRCAACGYDLRATPHRCPECGTAPKNSN